MVAKAQKPVTIGEKAAAVGVSERTLHAWGARGCPIHEGINAINEWRSRNVLPRNGGPRRLPGAADNDDGDIANYFQQTKPSLTLLDCRNRVAASDPALSADERAAIDRKTAALIIQHFHALWLRLPGNRQWMKRNSEGLDSPGEAAAFEEFQKATIADIWDQYVCDEEE